MFGKSNLVKRVTSFVSVCFLSPSGSSGPGTVASLWISLPLVDPEKKDTFEGPPLHGCDVKGSGGFRSLHSSSNAKATQESPLASGCWALAALPPPRVLLSFQTNREALPALQPACCQAGLSYPDHLPTGRRPASGLASPGSALGMVPSFLPRS